ncbi:GtrA family protein [Sinomonas atrocyanea]|uniref:GtrA family protein n=1 Tax=Sinomonas atrocyanea TaxID=37927 RepID=UPI003593C4E2
MVRRIARFGAVGMLCLCLQLAVMKLTEPFLPVLAANAIGFITSAQLNFTLSYLFTWGDSKRQSGWHLAAKWFSYCLVAVGATFINSAAFAALHILLRARMELIAVFATVVSTCCTFLFNHFLVFRSQRSRHGKDGDSTVYARMERG